MKINIDKAFKDNSFNAKLLLKELNARKVSLSPLKNTFIISAKFKSHDEKFYDTYLNLLPYTKGILIDDKYLTKKYLISKSILVNKGEVFEKNTIKDAIKYAKEIEFPVVFKPTMSSHGENVVMDIKNEKELLNIIKKFISLYKGRAYYIIEEQFEGNEYRLFITKNNFFAAVKRVPANIKGDGKSTIRQLVIKENYRRMNPRNTCLCEIPLDEIALSFLKKRSLSVRSIPLKDEVIYLRKNSNVSTGGNCFDVTEIVHKKYKKLSKKILDLLDAPLLGIDLLCKDISKFGTYAICELNSSPGISLHMMPEKGKSRDVARAIADLIFPETK